MIATRTPIFAAVAAAFLPGMSLAQDTKHQGYLVDTYGNSITTSSTTGLCWRDSDWTPARSVEPCDPVARKAEAPAPRIAAAPPPEKPKAPPARMEQRRVNFSADTLFAFKAPANSKQLTEQDMMSAEWGHDYSKALENAAAFGKGVIIDFYADW